MLTWEGSCLKWEFVERMFLLEALRCSWEKQARNSALLTMSECVPVCTMGVVAMCHLSHKVLTSETHSHTVSMQIFWRQIHQRTNSKPSRDTSSWVTVCNNKQSLRAGSWSCLWLWHRPVSLNNTCCFRELALFLCWFPRGSTHKDKKNPIKMESSQSGAVFGRHGFLSPLERSWPKSYLSN